jgi:hypothetical protein
MANAIKCYKDKGNEVLLSTIVNWGMPAFATSYNDLFIYIKESVKESERRPEHSELTTN